MQNRTLTTGTAKPEGSATAHPHRLSGSTDFGLKRQSDLREQMAKSSDGAFVKLNLNNGKDYRPEGSASARPQRLNGSAGFDLKRQSNVGDLHMSTRLPSSRESLSSVGDSKLDLNNGEAKRRPEARVKRLSDKYLAGFLDADGSIQLHWCPPVRPENWTDKTQMRCYAKVQFDQTDREFIEVVARSLTPPSASEIWGRVEQEKKGGFYWRVTGRRAVSVLMRLKKYLVNYRQLAEVAIEMNATTMTRAVGEARFKAARDRVEPMPKHPARKWVAGYLDGNGHLGVRRPPQRGVAQVVIEVSDEARDRTGIDLLAKQYGGSVQEHVSPAGTALVKWVLSMPPSKIIAMFDSSGKQATLAKNMVVKKDLAYFLLGCARSKDFHDRDVIAAEAKRLRAQPHRLSDPSMEVQHALACVADRL